MIAWALRGLARAATPFLCGLYLSFCADAYAAAGWDPLYALWLQEKATHQHAAAMAASEYLRADPTGEHTAEVRDWLNAYNAVAPRMGLPRVRLPQRTIATNPSVSPQTDLPAPPPSADASADLALWEATDRNDAAQLHTYLERYPMGSFVDLARAKLTLLEAPHTQMAALSTAQAQSFAAPVQQAVNAARTMEKQAREKAAQAVLVQSQAEQAAKEAEAAALRAGSGSPGTKAFDRTCRGPLSSREVPCHYVGEVDTDGKRSGYGVLTWSEGGRFEGEWHEDDRSGLGVMTWPDNHRYDGEWRNDHRSGLGVVAWADGDRYEGEFSDQGASGAGLYIGGATRGYSEKVGQFRKDRLDGYAIIYWKDGWNWIGKFENTGGASVMNDYGAKLDLLGIVREQGLYKDGKLKTAILP